MMDLVEFRYRVEQVRQEFPAWFALEPDQFPGSEALDQAQVDLGASLPADYRSFITEFGGGDFGLSVVYSVEPDSDLNIVVKNRPDWLDSSTFIAISDNGVGDYYGYRVSGGACEPGIVVLDHETRSIRETSHADLFELLVETALRPA
jgi:hypothetical protein